MATLKVTVKEELVLNGKDMGNENFLSISGINSAEHRIIDVATAEQSILLFDSAVAAGTYADSTLKHLRITNLDSTNFVQLRFVRSGQQYYAKVEPGETFILGNSEMYADATGSSSSEAFGNIDAIHAKANTAACELEVFIATT
jgi:hypothetical protein|tara:strand:- start:1246 stop:1677 length:432 start_codon:yes stop_codon:yes gene_type:complete